MIDTRYYAVVSSGSELATVVEENTIIRKQNYYLLATLAVVTIAMGILLYQNYSLDHKKREKLQDS